MAIIEVFGINMYQFYLSKKKKNSDGFGQIQEKKIFFSDKLDINSIVIFLNFITSDMKDARCCIRE